MCSKSVLIFLLLQCQILTAIYGLDLLEAEKKFKEFIEKYKKPYKDDATEYKKRFENFLVRMSDNMIMFWHIHHTPQVWWVQVTFITVHDVVVLAFLYTFSILA